MEQRLPVDQLSLGMFVVELDRPWLDTPFLLQGFLVEDEATLDQLRKICQHVVVDYKRSVGSSTPSKPSTPRDFAPRQVASGPRIISVSATVHARAQEAASGAVGAVRDTSAARRAERTRRASPAPSIPSSPVTTQSRPLLPSTPGPDAGAEYPAPARPPGLLERLRGLFVFVRRTRVISATPADATRGGDDPCSAPVAQGFHPLRQELPRASASYDRTSRLLQDTVRDIRMGKGLEIEAVNTVVEDVVECILRNPGALQLLSRLRDSDRGEYGHALQNAVLLVSFGRELGFGRAELQQLGQIGMLFDIGKLRVPASILDKHGTLSPDEFEEAKRHVDYGLEMLREAGTTDPAVLAAVAQHHERLDGSGYPKRLRSAAIGAYGRMAGIVDCFGAMTSPRPYAETHSAYDAMRLLQKWGDRYFNAGMVEQFIQAIGIFPVGTLVELSTGEAAVIVEQHPAHRLKPRVLVITDAQRAPLDVPITLDLLYGARSPGTEPPYIRRGLPAESVGSNSAQFYLAHL